jgi:hypothetical protein
MPDPEVEFVAHDGFVEARYLGSYTVASYKRQMKISVDGCLQRKQKRLLVDITGLKEYAPTTAERHQIGVYGADVSRDLAKVAALGNPDQIEGSPLASMVARNRGLEIRAFTDRAKAVAWLLEA